MQQIPQVSSINAKYRGFWLKFLFVLTIFLLIKPAYLDSNTYKSSFTFSINSNTLAKIDSDLRSNKYGKISSILIYNGSKIYFERYYGFTQASTLHAISSVTKSVTSLAMGICIDKGFVNGIDIPVYTFFPELNEIFEKDTLKKTITIRNLLDQTTGLRWDEWTTHYSYAGNSLIELSQNPNKWYEVILGLPLDTIPGENFIYNSGCSEVIKEIISRSSGKNFEDFVRMELLNKIGISSFHWDRYPGNGAPAWGGISLNTRDMARLGILILNRGYWMDQQIVSEAWIEESTKPMIDAGEVMYGLHWWVTTQPDGNPLVYAAGYGDQYVYIAPDKNLVIAFNGQNFTDHKWEKNHNDLVMDLLNAYSQQK
ncbi:MAG TPA: serine hydrolase [Tenuifilaceae bacterium]|nr:serine hydrolase [Tenuifilaceae bacterium]HPE17947.1 serine hydrolase [Tenuifilaceae bacterium]HPJ45380.1 serine hydrolase [Tenuifilaceae bacterium]HPQ33239.1 serine hydrolase [Tenuifilaceae bacterium]HRX67927.1 serine hydrolase [Tenuifilaceae bacterium]